MMCHSAWVWAGPRGTTALPYTAMPWHKDTVPPFAALSRRQPDWIRVLPPELSLVTTLWAPPGLHLQVTWPHRRRTCQEVHTLPQILPLFRFLLPQQSRAAASGTTTGCKAQASSPCSGMCRVCQDRRPREPERPSTALPGPGPEGALGIELRTPGLARWQHVLAVWLQANHLPSLGLNSWSEDEIEDPSPTCGTGWERDFC